MHIAIVTFEGFNELDSLITASILNRLSSEGWKAEITSPSLNSITSMHGLCIQPQRPLDFANEADVVLFGSGIWSEAQAQSAAVSVLRLNPEYQLIGSQCSGALFLDALGLLPSTGVSTDAKTKGILQLRGISVTDRAVAVGGNIATAGGCLSSIYLAAWVIARLAGVDTMANIIGRVAPVGEVENLLERISNLIEPTSLTKAKAVG